MPTESHKSAISSADHLPQCSQHQTGAYDPLECLPLCICWPRGCVPTSLESSCISNAGPPSSHQEVSIKQNFSGPSYVLTTCATKRRCVCRMPQQQHQEGRLDPRKKVSIKQNLSHISPTMEERCACRKAAASAVQVTSSKGSQHQTESQAPHDCPLLYLGGVLARQHNIELSERYFRQDICLSVHKGVRASQ